MRRSRGRTRRTRVSLDYLDGRGLPGLEQEARSRGRGQALRVRRSHRPRDDYGAKKIQVCTILKDCVVAGVVTQGTETEAIALSNDQSFDYKFSLPDRIPVELRLTIAQSANNQVAILSDEDVAALLLANITARYRLGLNFEPQRYFSIVDAPWAASVLLEWSTTPAPTGTPPFRLSTSMSSTPSTWAISIS
jgi:hypothetical protein